jgi:raffinose/stachyose/melibiose transport system substrate-binding protein
MKRTLSKRAAKILAAAMAVALLVGLAGCGTSSQTDNNPSTVQPTSSAPAVDSTDNTAVTDSKPVTLKFLGNPNPTSNDAYKAIGEKFTAANPSITFDFSTAPEAQYKQTLTTRAAANDVDIFGDLFFNKPLQDWTKGVEKPDWQKFIEEGFYADITGQSFLANYTEASVQAYSFEGKNYGLPLGIVAYNGIFYSKDLFEKYGLQPPQTWDEFVKICETLKSNGVAPMTIAGKDGWPYDMMTSAFVNANQADCAQYGKDLYTGAKKFTDPEAIKIFTQIDQFNTYIEKGFTGVDYNSVIGRFVGGKAAMLPDGTWQGAAIEKADPNFKFGYFAIPGYDKRTDGLAPQLAGKYDYGLFIYGKASDDSKNAALKFFDFFSQKENYTEFINAVGFLPTQPDVQMKDEFIGSLAPLLKDYKPSFEFLLYTPKGIGQYNGFVGKFLKSAGGPVASIQELAEKVQKDFEDALAKAQ